MVGAVVGIGLLIGFMLLITYAHGPGRADGKPKAVWDCGDADCRYRNRAMHKHP